MKTNAKLIPMDTSEFDSFHKKAVPNYAKEIAGARGLSKDESLKRSAAEFKTLLPKGLKTPDNFFYSIDVDGKSVGTLWLACKGDGRHRRTYIFDILVFNRFQGKGYGRLAMDLVTQWSKEKKAKSIGLNVFAHNLRAHSLYLSCGYEPRSIGMVKVL